MANFIENALPTIGGIAGGILGGLGGAVAAPFTGGIVNPVDAGIAGAGLLGGAGQAAKNALTGQKVLQGNVLSSAGENALGQATGEGIGILGKGLLGGLGGAAERGATGLLKGQFAKGAIDDATTGALRDMGVTDANQVGQIHPLVTGTNGVINKGVMRGIQDAGTTSDLSTLEPLANELIRQNGNQLDRSSAPTILETVQNSLKKAINPEDVTQAPIRRASGGFSNAPKTISVFDPGAVRNALPENAFQISKDFDTLANAAKQAAFDKSGAVTNPDQAAKYNIFRSLADEAERSTFGSGDTLPLTEENRAQIIQDLAPLKDVNPQTYNYFVNKVSNAQNLQELRGIQAPIVRAGQALNLTQNVADKAGGNTVNKMLGGGSAALGLLTKNPLEAAGGVAALAASHPAAGKIGTSVLSRMGDILTNPLIQKSVQAAAAPATVAAANVPNYTFGGSQGGAMTPTATTLPAAGGAPGASPEALQMMLGLIGLQADPYMASSFAPMVTGAVQPLQRAATAESALQGLQGLYGQAGGGEGGVGGLLAKLQSLIPGTAGNQYNRQAGQLQQTLQGLGVPGTAMPSLLSGAPTAQAGFGTIQDIINSLGGNPGSVLAGLPA